MLLMLAALTAAALQGTDTTVSVRAGSRLNLDNFDGTVTVTTWSRSAVRVQATHDDDTRVDVDVRGNSVGVRGRSRGGPPEVDYRITVPADMALELSTHSGDISVDGVRRILDELDQMDERFVREVARRIPIMSRILADLQQSGTPDFVTSSQLAPLIEQVEALHDASEAVEAGTITMFLQGLRAFLTGAAYRKQTALPQRLAAVDSRIQALLPMAEQWVSIGRVERAAIAEILPVG